MARMGLQARMARLAHMGLQARMARLTGPLPASVRFALPALFALPAALCAESYDFGISGDIATPGNWSSASGQPDFTGTHNYFMSNGYLGTLAGDLELNGSYYGVGQNDGSAGAASLTVQSGGQLSVGEFRVAVGPSQSGTSRVTIQSGGAIEVTGGNGSQIGVQSDGELLIEANGSFTVNGDVRVGNVAGANGLVTNRGSFSSNNLILSENGGDSRFVNEAGATASMAHLFFNSNGPGCFAVHGSGGSIQLTNNGIALTANHANASFEWIFDAGGITAIEMIGVNSGGSIAGAGLSLDIDAVGAPGDYLLIDQNGSGLGINSIAELGTVNWLGIYAGELKLIDNDLYVTVTVPESNQTGLLFGALGGGALLSFRLKRSRPAARARLAGTNHSPAEPAEPACWRSL